MIYFCRVNSGKSNQYLIKFIGLVLLTLSNLLVAAQTAGSFEYVPRTEVPYRWVFLVGLVVLILVGFVRSVDPLRHRFAIQAAFVNVKGQFERLDGGMGINPVMMLQAFISCVIIALGIFLIRPFDFNFTLAQGFKLYLLVLMAVCLAYTFKYFIHYIVALVLQSETLGDLMIMGVSNMMYAFTLLFFPFILVWYYMPSEEVKAVVEYTILAGAAIFMVWRLIKSIFIYYRYFPFSKIYIIIYLCALEIIPFLIMGKIISEGL